MCVWDAASYVVAVSLTHPQRARIIAMRMQARTIVVIELLLLCCCCWCHFAMALKFFYEADAGEFDNL